MKHSKLTLLIYVVKSILIPLSFIRYMPHFALNPTPQTNIDFHRRRPSVLPTLPQRPHCYVDCYLILSVHATYKKLTNVVIGLGMFYLVVCFPNTAIAYTKGCSIKTQFYICYP